MASEHVIELGSSDDEAKPAPKRSKPMPNAMVCIPSKLHEVTIKPANAKSKGVPASKGKTVVKGVPTTKGLITGRGSPMPKIVHATSNKNPTVLRANPMAKKVTTITKLPINVSMPFSKIKSNGKPVQKTEVKKPNIRMIKPIKMQKPSTSTSCNESLNFMAKMSSALRNKNFGMESQTSLSNLPSGLTVKKTNLVSPHILFMNPACLVRRKVNTKPMNAVSIVELDDDEPPPTTSGPAWYIRPEEQTEAPTLEEENNKEPEPATMIEITIEDSPIKPVSNKRTCEVGAEFAITIDDSPSKGPVDKNTSRVSDDEATIAKVPNSKKMLVYPKASEDDARKTVEIEIDIPLEASFSTNNTEKNKVEDIQVVRVEEASEPKNKQEVKSSTRKTTSLTCKENNVETPSSSRSEFHSVYQSFIDLCFQLENSEDMKKIVENKIKTYYRQVPKDYTESEEFIDMVASKVNAMRASPEKMYLYIKDIVDELNMQRKVAKSRILNTEATIKEPDQFSFGEDNEYDTKRRRQIRKLEKTIKKLHRAIQKLEEQEIDFDDEDDSVYLLTERYKERMVRVYAKFCQLTNTKMPSEPRIVIEARQGQPAGPAKRLEKWINKKVPIGTPLPFPDFHDVLRCVREANNEDKLCWNEADIMEEARDLFTRCGKKLQRRRQENEWRLAASRITLDVDPAENNEELKFKLEKNKRIAANKENEIFNKFADRQNQLKLEGVEIGDKEAEESPVESEEEPNDESTSLEDKGKRKEILKRILHDISKGPSDEKEKQPSPETEIKPDYKLLGSNEKKVTSNETDDKENKNDSAEILDKSENNAKDSDMAMEPVLLSSDDSNDLESDIDELHLLQKLHSGDEAQSSTPESSGSESPVAISDSFDSDSETKNQLSDVISIENSSYSESEVDKTENMPMKSMGRQLKVSNKANNETSCQPDNESKSVANADTDINDLDCSKNMIRSSISETMDTEGVDADTDKVIITSNNNEYNESVEDILLASSEEDTRSQEAGPSFSGSACINLKDDLISIDETVVGNIVVEPEKDEEEGRHVPELEMDVDEPSTGNIKDINDVLKDGDKIIEKINVIGHINTTQNEGFSSSKETLKEVSVVSNDTKSDTVAMDDDQPNKKIDLSSREKENLL